MLKEQLVEPPNFLGWVRGADPSAKCEQMDNDDTAETEEYSQISNTVGVATVADDVIKQKADDKMMKIFHAL